VFAGVGDRGDDDLQTRHRRSGRRVPRLCLLQRPPAEGHPATPITGVVLAREHRREPAVEADRLPAMAVRGISPGLD
jgi:hypothetical protein